jgi:signal transduction histidine kinase
MQKSEEFVPRESTMSPWNGIERRRVEKVVETLATLHSPGESISEVAHDARNMVTALGLYCDLLEEPGVLATAFTHYAHELRLVAAASRRLVEKLVTIDANALPDGNGRIHLEANAGRGISLATAAPGAGAWAGGSVPGSALSSSGRSLAAKATSAERSRRWDLLPALPIANLAAELLANRNLLSALAGPSIAVTMETDGGAQAVRLSGEDLTRLLVNLVKNAAEAMPEVKTQTQAQTQAESQTSARTSAETPAQTPVQTSAQTLARTQNRRIHIGLRERETAPGAATCLALTVEDNGQGIAEAALDRIFTSGFTSRGGETATRGETPACNSWPQNHRGLGLAIVRSIVEGAGGRITASNRMPEGACFTLELPVRKAGG